MGKKKDGGENIRVVVRCRNLLPHELEQGHKQAVRMDLASQQVIVQHPVGDPDTWTFDAVFNNTFTQKHIFTQEVLPLCDAVMQGYNATVFAYGQSGSGKTYTMTGDLQGRDPAQHGMMPQVVDYLFNEIKKQTSPTKSFKVKVQYIELYNGKARCLLSPKKENLEVKQNTAKNFYVKGAMSVEVTNWDECIEQFNAGTDRRCTASTELNAHSSRSHALFTLQVESFDTEHDSTSPIVMTSKINIVDLAGSEKLSKTGATGDTMQEGCNINLSLSALATVIDKIVKRDKHIPYRGSPLTMLLKDSLGGNSKTVMFANCGPSDNNISETISTLRFAERAKQIENKPVKNMDPKDKQIQDLLDKIAELEKRVGGNGLEEEEKLKEQIEALEVENDQLRQSAGKDTLALEETNKKQQAQIKELEDTVAAKQNALESAEQSKKVMESNFEQDLGQLRDLRQVATNFLKRACSADQLQLIRSKIPPDHLTDGEIWEPREIEMCLDGFVDVYEDWRRNVYTTEDLQKEVQRARADVEQHMASRVGELEREVAELQRVREEEAKERNAGVEAQSATKVELTNAKEENAKLREKIERDQERMKKKLDKMREEAKAIVDEADGLRSDLAARDREIEKLKKMLEDGHGGGRAGAPGASPTRQLTGDADHDRLVSELEETRMAKQLVETRMREMNLLLRRKGICVVGNTSGGAPPAPPPPGSEAEMLANDTANDAFMLANTDGNDIDGDLVSQMQQQLRVQHRLHQLRHAQQRKLEDILRKYEMLKTGQVTPVVSSGATMNEAQLQEAVAQAVLDKEKNFNEASAEYEKTIDKLVKKLNKKSSEWAEKEKTLLEEKAALEEERDELTAHVDDLSKFNSQLAVEVENMRSQAKASTSASEQEIIRLQRELDHVRGEMARLQSIIDGGKRQADELEDLRNEHQRLQQQNARTEASLKEKMAALDSSRQMIKWSNSLLEAEKKKVTEAEEALVNAEKQYREMEETWRQQMMDNSNKLVALNNARLEDQAAQYQALIAEEQEKQKAMRERVKKARSLAQKSAQKYDEMVLENEVLLTQFEEVKVSAMRMFRDQQRAATEDTSDGIRDMIRGQRRDLDAFGGGGGARPQSAYRR